MLKMRRKYANDVLRFRDTDLIKVVTGVRRCGKSTLLALVRDEISRTAPSNSEFVFLNLESMTHSLTTPHELYNHVKSRLSSDGRTYIFLDEPQQMEGWERAVNAMRVDFDCDIYITGSNAYLLSSELSTYLSGRYVEIAMLPLSFSEYVDFCELEYAHGSSVAINSEGKPVLFDDLFGQYLLYGGMPALARQSITQEEHSAYMSSLYDAIVLRDIVKRERGDKARSVTSETVLRKLAAFLADSVGNPISASSIANTLTNSGVKTNYHTVDSYMKALADAYVFYPVARYDVKGKELLRDGRKRYIVDVGFRSLLEGYKKSDTGRVFENAVFLELLYQGFDVRVGKLYSKEIDFVATKNSRHIYIQVAENMYNETTLTREFSPLRSIRDSYPKMVIVREGRYGSDSEGISIVGARDFFLHDWQSNFYFGS